MLKQVLKILKRRHIKRILLDCDPGLDDALAILLALGSPKRIALKAIVATFGNVGLDQTKSNLLKILGFFKEAPLLGSGSKCPLECTSAPQARYVHGRNGLGGVSTSFIKQGKVAGFKNGIDLIIDLALSNKIDTIVATGPLTDLAKVITRAPAILKRIDELVIMGGAVFVKGNVTPYAEFNFHCDPGAARQVLNADVKKRLVSLDVTQKTPLTSGKLRPLRDLNTALAKFICRIADYSIKANKKRGFSGAPMHDPLAVALAIDPAIGEYENLRLDVETKGKARGRVVVKRGNPNTLFARKVNAKEFFRLFIGALVKLAREKI